MDSATISTIATTVINADQQFTDSASYYQSCELCINCESNYECYTCRQPISATMANVASHYTVDG